MADKNFKPDKSAKVTGGYAGEFASAVNQANSAGDSREGSSKPAANPAWAEHVNQIDWEVPATHGATPTAPHD